MARRRERDQPRKSRYLRTEDAPAPRRGIFREHGLKMLGAVGLAVLAFLVGQIERDRKEDQLARGTARSMLEDFDHAVSRLCEVGEQGHFLDARIKLTPQSSPANRLLVASRLSPEDWSSVARSERELQIWEALYSEFKGQLIDPSPGQWAVGEPVTHAATARRALRDLAGYKGDDSPRGTTCATGDFAPPADAETRKPPEIIGGRSP